VAAGEVRAGGPRLWCGTAATSTGRVPAAHRREASTTRSGRNLTPPSGDRPVRRGRTSARHPGLLPRSPPDGPPRPAYALAGAQAMAFGGCPSRRGSCSPPVALTVSPASRGSAGASTARDSARPPTGPGSGRRPAGADPGRGPAGADPVRPSSEQGTTSIASRWRLRCHMMHAPFGGMRSCFGIPRGHLLRNLPFSGLDVNGAVKSCQHSSDCPSGRTMAAPAAPSSLLTGHRCGDKQK
jgi:hypothetical protein